MESTMQYLHWMAAMIVLAEALNKLERTAPFRPGIDMHTRIVDGLKAAAWCLLALGAGGGVISPALPFLGIDQFAAGTLMRVERPTLAETAVMAGFALLIIRTRIKEG
jgi:hypothetical protein